MILASGSSLGSSNPLCTVHWLALLKGQHSKGDRLQNERCTTELCHCEVPQTPLVNIAAAVIYMAKPEQLQGSREPSEWMWRKLFRWQMGRVYAATTTTKPFLEVIWMDMVFEISMEQNIELFMAVHCSREHWAALVWKQDTGADQCIP